MKEEIKVGDKVILENDLGEVIEDYGDSVKIKVVKFLTVGKSWIEKAKYVE